MTLVAFVNHGTHVDIATDTGGWDSMQRDGLSYVTKFQHLAHLDAVMLRQGDGNVARTATYVLDLLGNRGTFDDLIDVAPEALTQSLRRDDQGASREVWEAGTVVLVGWSERADAFVGYELATDRGMKAHKVDRMFLPMPWTHRPGALELRRLKAVASHTDWGPAMVEAWPLRPPFTTPATDGEWLALADLAREQRALNGPAGRVHVSGSLWLSTLKRGEFSSRRVHTWDDSGDNFRRMVAGSHHPISQAAPCCYCDSGLRGRDCCLARANAEHGSCLCGSGKPFEVCCRID